MSGSQPPVVSSRLPSNRKRRQTFFRWLKFNTVGGIGIVVQLAALFVFRSWLKLNYLLATGLAVEIAVLHNFLWHERFTWADRPLGAAASFLDQTGEICASNAGDIDCREPFVDGVACRHF